MALEGKIVDFGVADIIQLISQQQKTGVLLVEQKKQSAEITFWNGMILSAQLGEHPSAGVIEAQLLKSGLITDDQLQKALEIRGKTWKSLVEIMVEQGALSKKVLERILQSKVYDVFFEIFQWREGSYFFHSKAIDFNEEIFAPLGLEHILLDVLRMIDEWPSIEKRIPSPHTLFRITGRVGNEEKDILSSEHHCVLRLVAPNNTVQDMVDKSLLGKFATYKLLVELLDAGYVEIVPGRSTLVGKRGGRRLLTKDRIIIAGGLGVLAFLLTLLIIVSPPRIGHTLSPFVGKYPLPMLLALEQNRMYKIRNALQIYFWERGSYPYRLEELVTGGLLDVEDIKDLRGKQFVYSAEGMTYQLSSSTY